MKFALIEKVYSIYKDPLFLKEWRAIPMGDRTPEMKEKVAAKHGYIRFLAYPVVGEDAWAWGRVKAEWEAEPIFKRYLAVIPCPLENYKPFILVVNGKAKKRKIQMSVYSYKQKREVRLPKIRELKYLYLCYWDDSLRGWVNIDLHRAFDLGTTRFSILYYKIGYGKYRITLIYSWAFGDLQLAFGEKKVTYELNLKRW
ncbi:MAG: hypothetical protein DRJ60_00150 [Thermoprotei archaeon]|nr:MAG: hypothetical protein DRJ60_00150 [Thermoprotei archaeon]